MKRISLAEDPLDLIVIYGEAIIKHGIVLPSLADYLIAEELAYAIEMVAGFAKHLRANNWEADLIICRLNEVWFAKIALESLGVSLDTTEFEMAAMERAAELDENWSSNYVQNVLFELRDVKKLPWWLLPPKRI